VNLDVSLGAVYRGGGNCDFLVWAPNCRKVDLHILSPHETVIPLEGGDFGYFRTAASDIQPGARYRFRLDDEAELPDPASRYQPEGVHGPSEVISSEFAWNDSCWFGLPLKDYILYEVHVGTYTPEGTFDAFIPHLDYLVDLGITAVELMPVVQFPGTRNWGYDGAYPFAVHTAYGGPAGLKRLVDACHAKGLAAVLDVVYNHLGPEGNYLVKFGPYFTSRHKTPWGEAVNFDDEYSDGVRRYFTENAIYWLKEFHFDALRLDAVHAILDFSAEPFLERLGVVTRELSEKMNRRLYLIPESDLNDARLIRPRELGGYGLDAQWCDDFHHSLRALLTAERTGYYQDFGELAHLAKSFREGYVYSGQYSRYRRRRHGNSSREAPAERFVVFSQNHDQVGNRMQGERLTELVEFDALKLAAAVVLLSPFLPLLFMGEEYGETARFPYFISHGDPRLVEAVRKGRRDEFLEFQWEGEPPDPQSEDTFRSAKLNHSLKSSGHHAALLAFYKELIRLRKKIPALAHLRKETMAVRAFESEKVLLVRRWEEDEMVACMFHFRKENDSVDVPLPEGEWKKILDAHNPRWGGRAGSLPELISSAGRVRFDLRPFAACVFLKQAERLL